MTLWIVLGLLIGAVAIFLVVASVLDRKKVKKAKKEALKLEEDQKHAYGEVYIWLELTIKENKKMLDKFVPSVGEFKMSDIREKAKRSIEKLCETKSYKLFIENKEYKKDVKDLDRLLHTNSNLWDTKESSLVENISDIVKKLEDGDYAEFTKKAKEEIKGIYK